MTVESPLAIRSDHAAGGAAAIKYVPGTTFPGGLATLYRLLYDDEGLQEQNTPVYVLPKTAQSCKHHPGFRFPRTKKNDAHGARDTLIDWGLYKLVNDHQELRKKVHPLEIFRQNKNCWCDEAM